MAEFYQYMDDLQAVQSGAAEKMLLDMVQFEAVTAELTKQGITTDELKVLGEYLWFYWDEKVPEGISLFR
jgi:hypothetical protein